MIDVAEYHGSEDIAQATLVRYVQLKHSTLRAVEPWTPSGLENTLKRFAQRYRALQQHFGAEILTSKLQFWFVSNRPISSDLLETVADAANAAPTRHPRSLKKLKRFTGLSESRLSEFCKLVRLEGRQDGYWKSDDTLCRWMAHYIAELIRGLEALEPDDRSAKLSMCADAILSVWRHRHELPTGKRPFEDIEPILRAIESLDPTDDTPRYFRSPRTAAD